MLRFQTLTIALMMLIGDGFFNIPVLAGATNLPFISKKPNCSNATSTFISITTTTTKTVTAKSSSTSATTTHPVPSGPSCDEICTRVYNECMLPESEKDWHHCMIMTCLICSCKCKTCKECEEWGHMEK